MAIEVPDEFRSFLRTEADRARDTSLDEARATAIRAYQGDKYGDEEEGRSQAVTRDVSEVVDFMLVGILGTIMAGGKAVEFDTEPEEVPEPTEQDPQAVRKVDYGAEATAAVHYQFMRAQKGYRILHDAGKAGMLEKTGIVKTYVEQRPPLVQKVEVPEEMLDITEDGSSTLQGQPVIAAEQISEGDELQSPIWRVSLNVPQSPVVRDENVPNEWFLCSPDTVDLDDSPYVGDKMPVSISKLVSLGYDQVELETIWGSSEADTVVQQARDSERSNDRNSLGNRTGANRLLWLHTEYPLYDLNEDGIAERLFVHRIGQHVLKVMEVDEQPYSGWSPIPMQHRFAGQSMADKTMDIQRIRSVLLRQGLDSIYMSNAPRTLLHEDAISENTIDDLLTVRAGAIVRYKGSAAPAPLDQRDTSSTSFQAMEMISAERESRTGVTRQSQGMNPDTTNKTFGGMAMLQANGDQIELYVTRNMAEMLVAPMFAKRYRLMREHLPPFKMKIDGRYRLVDPSEWPADPDIQINVGLGTGSKEQRLAYRRELMAFQQTAIAGGLRGVGEEQVYNSIKAFVDDTSLGVATDFWADPSQLGPAPEKTDPEIAKAQADNALKGQAQNHAHEQAMSRIALAREESVEKLAIERDRTAAQVEATREKSELELSLARDKAGEEARLAERRYNLETDLAERRFAFEQDMARRKGAVGNDDNDLTNYRPGGDLAA